MPSEAPADEAAGGGLSIQGVSKRFGRFAALQDVSLQARPGEFLALLGPSGSGKTTLLRVLAGLQTPDAGRVLFDGEDFLALSARERRVGMVFQHYALFRHMTVARNIAFGLSARPRRQRLPVAEIAQRVQRLLGLVQLEDFGERFPAQLSGGQRQRVALARALAIEPRLLLLDEPFGALDAKVRKELRRWLRRIHNETGLTTLFVTHDQEEAMDMADRVAILRQGRLEQIGAPHELREAPASASVFDFLGESSRLPCTVQGGRAAIYGLTVERVTGTAQGACDAWFRPHDAVLAADGPGVEVVVTDVLTRGGVLRVECQGPGGALLLADVPADSPAIGGGQAMRLRPRRVFVFPERLVAA